MKRILLGMFPSSVGAGLGAQPEGKDSYPVKAWGCTLWPLCQELSQQTLGQVLARFSVT